jgi:hypothetical protein
MAILVAPLAAEVQVNDRTDVVIGVFIPCAAGGMGEVVLLEGPLHTLVTFTINGDSVSGKFQFQPQGITGTGQTTGDKYQGTGATQETFTMSLQNGQSTRTYVNNFRIIGAGPGNNFLVHVSTHITFNADGTLTIFHDNFSTECK